MDNTDIKQPVILTKSFYNRKTGQTMLITEPERTVRRKKKVIAAGRGTKTVGKVLVARLRPFRFAMILGLQRRGISTKNLPFKTVIALYYNNFCVSQAANRKPLDVYAFNNNIVFKITEKTETYGQTEEARNMKAFTDIAEVVDCIIDTFRVSKERYLLAKSQGSDPKALLSDDEFTQAKACLMVEQNLLSKEKSDSYVKLSHVGSFAKWIIILGAAYFIIKSL